MVMLLPHFEAIFVTRQGSEYPWHERDTWSSSPNPFHCCRLRLLQDTVRSQCVVPPVQNQICSTHEVEVPEDRSHLVVSSNLDHDSPILVGFVLKIPRNKSMASSSVSKIDAESLHETEDLVYFTFTFLPSAL
jgi:hypothetical protein